MKTSKEKLVQSDIELLHSMGYAQELHRVMSGFSNFAISFTILSFVSVLTLFTNGVGSAGPVAGSIGWPLAGFFVIMVALSMAELTSAYPTAGGLYFWACKLGGPAWGWYTGWFNLIGQVAITAGIDYGMANFVNILLNTWFNTPINPQVTLIIFSVALVLHALMNIAGVQLVAYLNNVSVWWHLATGAVIVGALAFVPTHHSLAQSFHTGFTTSGFPFWYACLLGLLMPMGTFTGYDASAHMAEETIGAATRAPWGMVLAVAISTLAGYVLLMGLFLAAPLAQKADLATCQSAGYTSATDCQWYTSVVTNGSNPVGYILNTDLGTQFGTALFAFAMVTQFFCGMSSITANSRMFYAFSRDGAVPLSRLWHRLSKRFRTPANAIWLGAGLSFLLTLPSLWNSTAYTAVTSISTIGLYISYVLPVYLRRRVGESFKPGAWHLGAWGPIVNWLAIAWVAFISVVFMLPTTFPINNPSTFNYTPIVLIGVVSLLTLWWFVSVRHWFKGPVVQGNEAELSQIERELDDFLDEEVA